MSKWAVLTAHFDIGLRTFGLDRQDNIRFEFPAGCCPLFLEKLTEQFLTRMAIISMFYIESGFLDTTGGISI